MSLIRELRKIGYVSGINDYNNPIDNSQAIASQGTQVFTASGTFVIPAGVTKGELFEVGGGGAGGNYSGSYPGNGGGSGYTLTRKAEDIGWSDGLPITLTPGETVIVTIGAGGAATTAAGTTGGTTSFACIAGTFSATGGIGGPAGGGASPAGSGGSGGGGRGYSIAGGAGGADGANGATATVAGGTGQGHTTKEWGRSDGVQYAGAGGGGGSTGGSGGLGGGGNGAGNGTAATAGTNGLGGGGGGGYQATCPSTAGGRGMAILRWGYNTR